MPAPAPTPLASRGPAAARGVGLFLVGVLGAAAAAIAVDARFDLPAAARGLVFAGWLVLAVGLAHVWVIAPLGRPVPAGEWAAAARAAAETAVVALITLGFFTLALLVPGAGERVRRFAVPWYVPGDNAGFRVVVPSGDVTVARGEPVTLTAYLEPLRSGETVSDLGTLFMFREPETGAERATGVAVDPDELSVFAWTDRPARSFDYRVRAGTVTSGWYKVRVVDPIRLTDTTRVEVRPPKYRLSSPVTIPGFTDIRGSQFGEAVFTLGFSDPPAEVRLNFRPEAADATGQRVLVRATADGFWTATLPLTADGTARLSVTQKDGLTTDYTAAVRVTPDTPPRFVTMAGLPARPVTARPGERLELVVEAADDSNVAGVWVDRCANGDTAAVISAPILVLPLGPGRVGGRVRLPVFDPQHQEKEAWFRVRVADDRTTADPKVGRQTVVHPESGWAILRRDDAAPPLVEQILQADREETGRRLTAAIQALTAAADGIARFAVRKGDEPLPHEQQLRLRALADAGASAASEVGTLAADLALVHDLRPLAAALRSVADEPLRSANRAARAALDADTPDACARSATATRSDWAEAARRLRALGPAVERAGQARLDRAALERLADEVRQARPDDLAAVVKSVRQRLDGLTHRSPLLRPAVAAATADEAVELAGRVRAFTQDVASLTRAVEATEAAARRSRAAGPVGRQVEQDRAAGELAARAAVPLRLADAPPVAALTAGQAATLLGNGDATAAVSEQEKAAHEAERLADALRRAADARTDPREAVRQLARWQADLARRVSDAGMADRERFAAEQRRLLAAVGRLPPGSDDTARAAQLKAVHTAMAQAAEGIQTTAADRSARLTAAADAVARLADLTPSMSEQRRAAAGRLGELARQFEAIRREAVGGASKEQADLLAARVADLAESVGRLTGADSAHRGAVVAASSRLAADLRATADHDLPASLGEVRRQLARLATALAGKPTADELAVESAGTLRSTVDRSASLPDRPNATDLQPVVAALQETGKLLRAIPEDEGGSLLAQVRDAVGAVEQSARRPDAAREVRRLLAAAASAASTLANRLTGDEPAVERVRRLAQRRADWVPRLSRPMSGPAVREAERSAARDIEELEQTRVGRSRAAKQAALAALTRARAGGGDPAGLHRTAADALRRLADEMTAAGDGITADAPVGPPAPSTAADPFAEFTDDLPTATTAARFSKLAERQRAIRDETAAVAAAGLRGGEPAATDELAGLLTDLRATARAASHHVAIDPPEADPARLLADGSVGPAASAAGQLAGQLRRVMDVDRVRLAERLEALAARLSGFRGRYDVQAARQKARRAELAAEADRLAVAYRGANETAWSGVAERLTATRQVVSATPGGDQIGPLLAELVQKADEAVAAVRTGEPAPDRGTVRAGRFIRQASQLLTATESAAGGRQAAAVLEQGAKVLPVCPPGLTPSAEPDSR